MNGIYLFAEQIDKCREKVWKKGVEFEEGEKDLSSKGLFPLLKYRPLLGTEPYKKLLNDLLQKINSGFSAEFVFSQFDCRKYCATLYPR